MLGGIDITDLGRRTGGPVAGLGRSFQDARLFPALTVEETIAVALERWVDVRDPVVSGAPPAGRVRLRGARSGTGSTSSSSCWASRRSAPSSCASCPPGRAGSSTWPAWSPTGPTVVLLDEPSSGIAQRETEALGPLLLRIRDALGASLLVIEHDMPLVTSVADRLVALDQGRVDRRRATRRRPARPRRGGVVPRHR